MHHHLHSEQSSPYIAFTASVHVSAYLKFTQATQPLTNQKDIRLLPARLLCVLCADCITVNVRFNLRTLPALHKIFRMHLALCALHVLRLAGNRPLAGIDTAACSFAEKN